MSRERNSDRYAREMVMDLKDMANERRKPDADNWVEYYRLYQNQIDEANRDNKKKKALVAVPWPAVVIETYLPKLVRFLVGAMPYLQVDAEKEIYEDQALRDEKLINKQLWFQRFAVATARIFKDALMYGTGLPFIEQWGNWRGMNMPLVRPRRIFDQWVNPYVPDLYDPSAWVVDQTFMPLTRLKAMAKWVNDGQMPGEITDPNTGEVLGYEDVKPIYRNLESIKPKEKGAENPWDDEYVRQIEAISGRPQQVHDEYSNLVRLHTYYSADRIICVANELTCIRDTNNPTGRIPFLHLTPIPAPFPDFYAKSILAAPRNQFLELNELRSGRLEARRRVLQPMFQSRDPGMIGKRVDAQAGLVLGDPEFGGVAPVQQDWTLFRATEAEEQSVIQDIMDATNTFPQMRGQGPSRREPATTTRAYQMAGDIRVDLMGIILNTQFIEQIGEEFLELNRQFQTEAVQFRDYDKNAEKKYVTVMPADLEGLFSFKAVGGTAQVREVERAQFIELFTRLSTNPITIPVIQQRVTEWVKEMVEYFPDLQNAKRLVTEMGPDELTAAQEMERMRQEMAGGNGTAGGRIPRTGPEPYENSPEDQVMNSGAFRA